MSSDDEREQRSVDQMRLAREVMDRDWIVLRALALGDQHPDIDVETLIDLAREQAAAEGRKPSWE
jgi:hypothetical protein